MYFRHILIFLGIISIILLFLCCFLKIKFLFFFFLLLLPAGNFPFHFNKNQYEISNHTYCLFFVLLIAFNQLLGQRHGKDSNSYRSWQH